MTAKEKSDHIWGIFIHARKDVFGNSHFEAYLETEADESNQPLPTALSSTSKKGFFVAAANLCWRLDKSANHAFPPLPAKWQVYLIGQTPEPLSIFGSGRLLVELQRGTYFAQFMAPPFFVIEDKEVAERLAQQGILNQVEYASGKASFGSLANLCRKLHDWDLAHTIDSLVLDSLTAGFFLPAAIRGED